MLQEVTSGWAYPAVPYAGPGVGVWTVPPVGAGVWIAQVHYYAITAFNPNVVNRPFIAKLLEKAGWSVCLLIGLRLHLG